MGASESTPPEEGSFETALERLEEIVDRLESGELPLEEALAAFEEGVGLSRRCATQLEAAEQRIDALLGSGDGLETRSFTAEKAEEEG